MKEIELYGHYFYQFGQSIKKGFTGVYGFLTLMGGFIIALNGQQRALLALLLVFLLDMATGCIASWVEHKKSTEKIKVYFFESKKIRMSVVKAITYMLLIIFSWIIAILFFDVPIGLMNSSKQFTVVELTTGVCIAIEIWSNVENMKRAGFDILGKAKGLIKLVFEFKNLLKTGKTEE